MAEEVSRNFIVACAISVLFFSIFINYAISSMVIETGLQGEKGERGLTGPPGPEGPIGPTGETSVTDLREELDNILLEIDDINSRIDEILQSLDDESEPDEYVGSINSDVYHRPTCPYVDAILEQNRIYFSSTQEAEQAGYRACLVCDP